MKKFTFSLTRDTTESVQVTIEADSIEDAHVKAVMNPPSQGWTPDDGNQHQVYIPDCTDYEEVEA